MRGQQNVKLTACVGCVVGLRNACKVLFRQTMGKGNLFVPQI